MKKSPESFGFSIVDLGQGKKVDENLRELIKEGHKVTIDCVMNNGNLRALVKPEIAIR